jgi:ribosomal silencing factor RsfS
LKQLAQAKKHTKDLEHKLSEALNNKGGNSTIWMVIAIVAIIILIVSFFLR